MTSVYFVLAIFIFLIIISVQLIRFNLYLIRRKKTKELNQKWIKEDVQWEFIKGLY